MTLKNVMTIIATGLVLTVILSGCGCQADKPVETTLESVPVPETTSAQNAQKETAESATVSKMQQETAPEMTNAEDAANPTQLTESAEEDWWTDNLPEDTRPPIEVTLPEETQPYTEYEQYMDMSGEEQKAYFDSFENEQAFFDWFNTAKAEYEKAHPPIIIDGSTNIELKP